MDIFRKVDTMSRPMADTPKTPTAPAGSCSSRALQANGLGATMAISGCRLGPMLSLLVGVLFGQFAEWLTPPNRDFPWGWSEIVLRGLVSRASCVKIGWLGDGRSVS